MSRNQDPKKPSGDSEFWREDRPAVVDGFSNNPRAPSLSRNKWNNLEILLHKQYSSRASPGSEVCCPPLLPAPTSGNGTESVEKHVAQWGWGRGRPQNDYDRHAQY